MITVLLADDSEVQLGTAEKIFGLNLGLKIVAKCTDGLKAWLAIEALKPDVAILDYMMPNLTGGEIAHRIRAANLPTKVILATAQGQKGVAYDPTLPVSGVLIKPYSRALAREVLGQAGYLV